MSTLSAATRPQPKILDWLYGPALGLASVASPLSLAHPPVWLTVLAAAGVLGVLACWFFALRSQPRSTSGLWWLGAATVLWVANIFVGEAFGESVEVVLSIVLFASCAAIGWFIARAFPRVALLWLLSLVLAVAHLLVSGNQWTVVALMAGYIAVAVSLALLTARRSPAAQDRRVVSAAAADQVRADTDLARRAAEITRWEQAYALAHNGEKPPAGYVPPATSNGHTNNFAVASLIIGIVQGGVVAIIFGHIALSQIKRTGEQGRGFAIAGLVIGYAGTAALLAIVLVFGVLLRR